MRHEIVCSLFILHSSSPLEDSLSTNNDDDGFDQVVVQEAGSQEVNGVYERKEESVNGPPEFSRIGTWYGGESLFSVRLGKNKNAQSSIFSDSSDSDSSSDSSSSEEDIAEQEWRIQVTRLFFQEKHVDVVLSASDSKRQWLSTIYRMDYSYSAQ